MDLFTHDELRGRLSDAASIRRFVEAGHATLTLVSIKTGARFTYRFGKPAGRAAEADAPIFVSLLSGPDNENDYSFVGTMFSDRRWQVRRSAKSRVGANALSFKGLDWFLTMLYCGHERTLLEKLEVWHEGRCGRCGRKLTVPDSVRTGFGPDCAEMMGL